MKTNNQDLYNNEEFDEWARRKTIIPEEKYILTKYLINKEEKILEGGCGGGRLLFNLAEAGFKNLYGFDTSLKLIEAAQEKNKQLNNQANFSNQNAKKLNYPDNYFDNIIYLQQIISLIEDASDRKLAVAEANRILKTGGLALFSFLDFAGRWYNKPLAIFLSLIRKARKNDQKISRQLIPWLRRRGKLNYHFLDKDQPLVYWFKKDETIDLLKNNNFEIIEIFSRKMLEQNDLSKYRPGGMLHVIAKKNK